MGFSAGDSVRLTLGFLRLAPVNLPVKPCPELRKLVVGVGLQRRQHRLAVASAHSLHGLRQRLGQGRGRSQLPGLGRWWFFLGENRRVRAELKRGCVLTMPNAPRPVLLMAAAQPSEDAKQA